MNDDTTIFKEGLVVSVSRRVVSLRGDSGEILIGTVSAKAMELAVGDRVMYSLKNGAPFVSEVRSSSRCLFRSYRNKKKKMGANIDRLLLITAADETFNVRVIDRMLVAAFDQDIPVSLVVNKVDLGPEALEPILDVYRDTRTHVIYCSAKSLNGLSDVKQLLEQPGITVAALAGVSGVGKSSILNSLVPEAECRIGDLSWKTGQGRQTTSQSQGYMYPNREVGSVLVIDYPGIQFFGVSHISESVVRAAFGEFARFSPSCQFVNCTHTHELQCGVKTALEDDLVAHWRYDSYVEMLSEIKDAKPY